MENKNFVIFFKIIIVLFNYNGNYRKLSDKIFKSHNYIT